MKIARDLYPQQEFLNRRSEKARQNIAESLKKDDARPVVVGVCQMHNHCGGEAGKQSNLQRMQEHVEAAAGEGVQVLVFPEMCLPGYFVQEHGTPEEAVGANHALADEVGDSRYLDALQQTAAKHEMLLTFGFCEKLDGEFFNAVGVVDADGSWLGTRHKNPLAQGDYDLKPFKQDGPETRSVVLDTRYGRVGINCCFDGEFPESVRRMRLDGAELLLWSNAGTGDPELGASSRFSQCGAHAQTCRMFVASVNTVFGSFYGNSCIYAPWGEPLVQLSHNEEALGIATINLALCSDWENWRRCLEPGMYDSPG